MTGKMPRPDLVDLHVHTTASDGVYTPRETVRRAAEAGLRALAVTDHDTVAGVADAVAAGQECGVEVVPGVEISAEFERGACHILGYFIDVSDEPLRATLAEARESRNRRNREILDKLRDLGFELSLNDVRARAGGGSVTRAHFAAAMLEKRYVRSWDEAFDRYLGRGKPANVYRKRMAPERAIDVIHGAGGLAVLAHPRQLNRPQAEVARIIERLAAEGLDGLETQSPDHSASCARQYRALSERLGLLEAGGTDWHGRADSDIRLGVGTGAIRVPYAVVEAMKDRLAARTGGEKGRE